MTKASERYFHRLYSLHSHQLLRSLTSFPATTTCRSSRMRSGCSIWRYSGLEWVGPNRRFRRGGTGLHFASYTATPPPPTTARSQAYPSDPRPHKSRRAATGPGSTARRILQGEGVAGFQPMFPFKECHAARIKPLQLAPAFSVTPSSSSSAET